jgi:hypothetical protein
VEKGITGISKYKKFVGGKIILNWNYITKADDWR